MTAVGFEPTRIAPPELESGALDRSAKLSRQDEVNSNLVQKHHTDFSFREGEKDGPTGI